MTTALEGGEGSASRPGRSLPPGKTRHPLYRRLGGTQGRSGQVSKISPPTGIRSPERPARSQSLYRLSYPADFTDSSKWKYAGHYLFIRFDTQTASHRSHCTDWATPVYFPAGHWTGVHQRTSGVSRHGYQHRMTNRFPFAFVIPSASTKQPLIHALLGPFGLVDTWQTVRTDTLIPLFPREERDLHVHIHFFINCMELGSRRGGWH